MSRESKCHGEAIDRTPKRRNGGVHGPKSYTNPQMTGETFAGLLAEDRHKNRVLANPRFSPPGHVLCMKLQPPPWIPMLPVIAAMKANVRYVLKALSGCEIPALQKIAVGFASHNLRRFF